MKLGGNDKLNAYLKECGYDKFTDANVKYNSPAAQVGGLQRVRSLWGTFISPESTAVAQSGVGSDVLQYFVIGCKLWPQRAAHFAVHIGSSEAAAVLHHTSTPPPIICRW